MARGSTQINEAHAGLRHLCSR